MTPRKTLKLLSKQLTIREDDWNVLLVFFWATSIATRGLREKRKRCADSLCLSFKSYSSKGETRLQVYLGFPRLNRLRKIPPKLRKHLTPPMKAWAWSLVESWCTLLLSIFQLFLLAHVTTLSKSIEASFTCPAWESTATRKNPTAQVTPSV